MLQHDSVPRSVVSDRLANLGSALHGSYELTISDAKNKVAHKANQDYLLMLESLWEFWVLLDMVWHILVEVKVDRKPLALGSASGCCPCTGLWRPGEMWRKCLGTHLSFLSTVYPGPLQSISYCIFHRISSGIPFYWASWLPGIIFLRLWQFLKHEFNQVLYFKWDLSNNLLNMWRYLESGCIIILSQTEGNFWLPFILAAINTRAPFWVSQWGPPCHKVGVSGILRSSAVVSCAFWVNKVSHSYNHTVHIKAFK